MFEKLIIHTTLDTKECIKNGKNLIYNYLLMG